MTSKEVLSEKLFHNGAGTLLSLQDIMEEIEKYIARYPDASYEIVIGSDSQRELKGLASFVTAIVVRRIGNGGIHFWARRKERSATLRDRIWREALLSITLAQELRSLMKEKIGEEIFWAGKVEFRCIHIDVGENGPTKYFIDGIAGMVKGYGFVPVIKPDSYGASVVADRHT
ncbi:MAG: ribonuclease H-like YkuK family protein [Candidatus Ryanbacteria bacterium]|nr:ribonuclease H-like YkuK family protein [Candidatus Ryanbacteria bacterium]